MAKFQVLLKAPLGELRAQEKFILEAVRTDAAKRLCKNKFPLD